MKNTMISEIRRLLDEQHEALVAARDLGSRQRYGVAEPYAREIDKLQGQAQKAFARLNGWVMAKTTNGAVKLIPKEKRAPDGDWEWPFYLQGISDHDRVYKEPGRSGEIAAVVCQPYGDWVAEARKAAELYGLAVHVPPNPEASFHYPGWTQFIVFTKPGVEVKWLDEQLRELEPVEAAE